MLYAYRMKTQTRICRHCGKAFETNNDRRLYCSERCRRHEQDEGRKQDRIDLAVVRAAERQRLKTMFRIMRRMRRPGELPCQLPGCPFRECNGIACLCCAYRLELYFLEPIKKGDP